MDFSTVKTRFLSTLGVLVMLSVNHASGRTGAIDAGRVVATGNMTAVRFDHAAALLPDGHVLIVGGLERNGLMQSSAEIFDPIAGRFSPAARMQSQHGWGVVAVTLPDGRVLIAGGSTGCDSPCYTASAELYDPAAQRFVLTGAMTVPRAGARALSLPTGEVLLVGGVESADRPAATAELYHPGTGRFSAAGAMHLPDPAQLVLLKNGQVLVVGASGTELYDPAANRFTLMSKMAEPRAKFGAAVLPDGSVLIVGGQTGGAWGPRVTSTQICDPVTSSCTPGPELNLARFKLAKAVVTLKNGRILVAGGAEEPEVYDPQTRVFSLVEGARMDGFLFSTATVLKDGSVLMAGGYARPGAAGVNHAWLYKP